MKKITKDNIPLVAIIGRVNVGKSTLFNRLSKSVRSMALDYEGVTRDYLIEEVEWQKVPFMLADTGGLELKKVTDPIVQQVQKRVMEVLHEASVVVLVIDASVGVTQYELELAKLLHKLGKPVLIAANKIDIKVSHEHLLEIKQLGFELVFPISAVHNQGIKELFDQIIMLLPRNKLLDIERYTRPCRVVLLGRPNVGKSSLMNLLLQKERLIVTDVPGTTREAITERLRFYAQTIEITDTAGVRKKKAVKEDIEELMVKSSLAAVRSADIVLLLAEAQEGRLTDQELKLAFYAFDEGKALIIVINKEDLLDSVLKDSWKYHKAEYDFFYKKIEMITLSCKTEDHVGKLLPLIDKVWQRYRIKFSDHEITNLFKQAMIHRPLYRQEQRVQLVNAKQVKHGPPTIKLEVNVPKLVGEREFAFFEGILRKQYQLKSVPVVFKIDV